jgi:hypothetical protein
MRKPPLDPSLFTFSPTAGTVTFAAGSTRPTHQAQIVSIVNTSNEIYLYLPVQSGRGGAYNATTGILTLEIATTAMNSGDALQIVIDDSEIGATSALQAAGNVLLGGIGDKLPPLDGGRWPVSGPLTDVELRAQPVPVSGTFWPATQPVSGTFWQTTQPVSGPLTNVQLTARLPILTLSGTRLQVEPSLATNASTATNQAASNVALGSIDGRLGVTGTDAPTLPTGASGLAGLVQVLYQALLDRLPAALSSGRLLVEPSLPTGAATAARQPAIGVPGTPSGDVLSVQGASGGTALPVVASPAAPINSVYQQATPGPLSVNTILIGPIDCANTRMLSIQCFSIGTGGLIVAEWAPDSSFSVGVFTAQLINATNGAALTTFAVGNYNTNVCALWFRLRLATATTGSTVYVNLQQWSETSFMPSIQAIVPVPGSFIALAATAQTTDVISATISASVTSANISHSWGLSFAVEISISGMSGANAWADFRIEQSGDLGATWYVIYDLPRITANGQYRSPALISGGNRWRYVQTLNTGTQLTRSISRLVFSAAPLAIRQRYDRTISLTTASSVTPALIVGDCRNLQMVIRADAIGTTAPVVQMQGTEDDWQSPTAAWYDIGAALAANAARPASVTVANVNTQAIRGIVVTAGSGGTTILNYVLLKGF